MAATRIAEALWGDDVTDKTLNTLQVHVSNLRRALAPAAEALGTEALIETRSPGYLLNLDASRTDLGVFEVTVADGRAAADAQDFDGAATAMRAALDLWRGRVLDDLADQPFHDRIAVRLAGRRRDAQMVLFDIELAQGRHGAIIDDLTRFVDDEPLDERACGLLMLALYRSGRQADALAAYQRLRTDLGDQLGLDPSPELRELENQILLQEASLAPPRPGGRLDEFATELRSSIVGPRIAVLHEGQRISLITAVTTLGRRFDCDIVVEDSRASRLHAELRLTASGVVVVDKGSMNGTRVNGEPIGSRQLQDGDQVSVGDTILTVCMD